MQCVNAYRFILRTIALFLILSPLLRRGQRGAAHSAGAADPDGRLRPGHQRQGERYNKVVLMLFVMFGVLLFVLREKLLDNIFYTQQYENCANSYSLETGS